MSNPTFFGIPAAYLSGRRSSVASAQMHEQLSRARSQRLIRDLLVALGTPPVDMVGMGMTPESCYPDGEVAHE